MSRVPNIESAQCKTIIKAFGAKSTTVYYNLACAPAYIPKLQYRELVSARGRAL